VPANLTKDDLHGVYPVATPTILKFDLLQLVVDRYGKEIELTADDPASSDRSLVTNGSRERAGMLRRTGRLLSTRCIAKDLVPRGNDV
jgi:hypothetical protein